MQNIIEPSGYVWTPQTKITLTNVPWSADYRDIVEFSSQSARDSWFNTRAQNVAVSAAFEQSTYARVDYPVRLEIPISDAYSYNYVRVQNPGLTNANGLKPTQYFYFISGVEMLNPSVTLFHLQLDVWTTYQFNVQFGQAYVKRGHIGIANSNSFNNFGRDFLTIPEGLDTGNEMQTLYHYDHEVMNTVDGLHNVGSFSIIIASTIELAGDFGTVSNPKLTTAFGSDFGNLPSGVSYYRVDSLSGFKGVMTALSKTPWISQGIISITMVPNLGGYQVQTENVAGPLGKWLYKLKGRIYGKSYNLKPNWRDSTAIKNQIPSKYRNLKKFFTSPYMMLELTTFNGAAITLRPESWNDPNAWISERVSLAAPNQRVVFTPVKYNAGRGSTKVEQEKIKYSNGNENVIGYYDDNGDYLDMHTQVANLPSFALVNNGYLSVMAGQAHSLGFSRDSADWSQQRALRSSNVSYDQANNTMDTAYANSARERKAAMQSLSQTNETNWMNMAVGGVSKIVGGTVAGGGPGAAMGVIGAAADAVGTAIGNTSGTSQVGIKQNAGRDIADNNLKNSEFLADSNKSLSRFAAKGNYENEIAGINARVADTRLTPPSMSGQAGGEVFNLVNGGVKLSLRIKMISYNNMCTIGDYWLRYGYAINRFLQIDKLSVMENFTYWELAETYLIGTYLSEYHKTAIRGIFEKGVTVWKNPDKIGVIDFSDNDPMSGIVIPVEPDPADYEEPEEPLIINPDEEDEMYLVTYANSLYVLGKEYMADNATTQVPQASAQRLIGVEPIALLSGGFKEALRMLNIPEKYSNRDTFIDENPDGIWSKSEQVINAVADNAEYLESVMAKLDALDAKIPDPA